MAMYGGHGWGAWRLGREAENPTTGLQYLPRILIYFRPYTHLWALVVFLLGLFILLDLVPPLLVRTTIDQAIPNGDTWLLLLLVGGMLGAPLVGELLGVWRNYLVTVISQGIMLDLRNQLYQHLQSLSLRFFTSTKTGDMMSRLNNDVGGVQRILSDTFLEIVRNVFTLIFTLAVIYTLDWRLATLSIAILPLFLIPTKQVGRIRYRLARSASERMGDLSAFMQETLSISGFLLMKAYAREAFEALRFRQKSTELMELQVRESLVGRWFFMCLRLFGALGPALIYGYGGWLVIQGELSIGTIVAFVALLGRLYGPVSSLANVQVEISRSIAHFERLFEYLDQEPEIAEPASPVVLPQLTGSIRFEGVSFGYVPGRMVLRDVEFKVAPGQLVALVGPSGAGKTTVTYLVPRLYDTTRGRVLIDDVDVRQLSLNSLRSQVGMVTQETFLFHASLQENLLYAKPEASQAELDAVCRAAHLEEFVQSLPEGFDTVVGERGYRLSGGEKQRVAIARVLLKDPSILLLDEATSSLDSRSEALIQAALAPLLQGRTSLVIAHRLSTILAADLILVLDKGRLVEHGRHQELLEASGLYARLYHQQFKTREADQAPELVGAAGAAAD